MNKQEIMNPEDVVTVTLTLDDDSELECEVVTILEARGKEFIALLPLDGPEKDTGNVYLYEFRDHGDGEPELLDIESDEDYEAASDAFDEYLDDLEFDELVDEDESDN